MLVAGYGRVSTTGQVKDGTSLEDQKRIVEDRCQKEGHQLYRFYSDEGISGGTLDRPALKDLIADARGKRFEAVLFTKLDRLGRSVRDIANLYHELHEECGINLICIDDPSLNTTGKMGDVMRGMLSTFAQFERAMIRERTLSGRAAKWNRGEIVIGDLPFGYKKVKGKAETVDNQAAIYLKIVGLYLDNRLSMKDIAVALTNDHIPTPSSMKNKKIRSSRWNSITIGDILKQPCYKGLGVYNQEKPEDQKIRIPFPPLISEDRWNQIQDRIQNQRHKPKRIFKEHDNHFMLDGFLFCGECGSRMRKRLKVETRGRKKARFYYGCWWRNCSNKEKALAGRSQCILPSVDADEVDRKIYYEVIEMITGPDKYLAAWMKDLNAEELRVKICNLEEAERNLSQRLKRGFKLISDETKPDLKDLYIEEQRKFGNDWEETKADLKRAKAEFEIVKNRVDRYGQFKEALVNTPLKGRMTAHFKTKGEFQKYMLELPFIEKKRLVEAIVSPENGGCCEVSYPRAVDFLSSEELENVPEAKWREPLTDRPPCITGTFNIDLGRIEAIIAGLNRNELLGKEHEGGVPLADVHGGQRHLAVSGVPEMEVGGVENEKQDHKAGCCDPETARCFGRGIFRGRAAWRFRWGRFHGRAAPVEAKARRDKEEVKCADLNYVGCADVDGRPGERGQFVDQVQRNADKERGYGHDPVGQKIGEGNRQDQQQEYRRGDDPENGNDDQVGKKRDKGEPVEIMENQRQRSERGAQGDEKKHQDAAAGLLREVHELLPFSCLRGRGFQRRKQGGHPRGQEDEGRHGGEGELKGDVEERVGRNDQDDKCRKCEGVVEVPRPVEDDRQHEQYAHDRRPDNGYPHAGNERIEDYRDDGKKGCHPAGVQFQKQILGRFEEKVDQEHGKSDHNAHIEPGNRDEVRGAGPVELLHHILRYLFLIAEDHRLDDKPVRSRGLLEYLVADAVPKALQVGPDKIPPVPAKHDDSRGVADGTPDKDSAETEVGLIVEGAGIVKITGSPDAGLEPDHIPVPVRVGGPNVQKNAARNRLVSVCKHNPGGAGYQFRLIR